MSVAHIFFEVHMGAAHKGLGLMLAEQTGDERPKPGEYAIFINRQWTALKMLTSNDIILYARPVHGINPDAIRHLPACVDGKELNYKRALEAAVKERYLKDFKLKKHVPKGKPA